ncbi:MAG TPA: hypothetical protein VFO39_15970 [Candidatus Sulfotelmatobacter sp.]|nr:hypothetical protein [Candidatus Sulfotelmatobacter sp.]
MRNVKIILPILLCALLPTNGLGADTWIVREDGVGPVKIGMTLAKLKVALQGKVSVDDIGAENCFYAHPLGHEAVAFMIIDRRLVRVDVDASGVKTSTGIEVGDSEAHVRQVYGTRMRVTHNPYIDTGHLLTVSFGSSRGSIRFVTDGRKITAIYAGTYQAIQYVEGCE